MKLNTTKAAKFSEDNAYSSSVSEPVSGGTTAQTLKSCCATIIASRTKTSPPRSQGTLRRRGRTSLDSLKSSVGLLTENGLITGQASAKSSTPFSAIHVWLNVPRITRERSTKHTKSREECRFVWFRGSFSTAADLSSANLAVRSNAFHAWACGSRKAQRLAFLVDPGVRM